MNLAKIIAAGFVAFAAFVTASNAAEFKFIAIGDLPYGKPKEVYPLYESLIKTINERKPDLVIHVGDTKAGSIECSDETLDDQLNFLNQFENAVIYTPGDNEWTDCYRKKAGDYKPEERLAYIRKTYFEDPERSFGKKPISVVSQAVEMADKYANYPENIRFFRDDIMIMTAHVVGSNNGFEVRSKNAALEFFERDKANVKWLKESFKLAEKEEAKAIVLAIHADMFEFDFNLRSKEGFLRHSGFKNFGEEMIKRAVKFEKPVLLVFGDSHEYRIIRPFRWRAPNVTALEVFGAPDQHGVEVLVDTDDPAVFAFRPVYNPDQKLEPYKQK